MMSKAARSAPAPRGGLSLDLPRAIRDELCDVAARAGRSTAFLARRALHAARGMEPADSPPAALAGPTAALALTVDEDDAADTLATIRERCGPAGGATLAAAWAASRGQFLAWLARHEAADRASVDDDLDRALADAAHPGTPPARLAALARHEVPRVRARVAGNPATAPEVLTAMVRERDKAVRERLRENPSLPETLRATLG